MDNIIIKLNVLDDTSFLSPYSSNDTPCITEEVASFLENQCLANKANRPIIIEITSNCIDENEKEIYQNAIKKYYQNKAIDYKYFIHRDTILSLGLIIVAFFIMITNLFYKGNSVPLNEMIDIAAWSFTCAGVEKFCFERTSFVRDYKRSNCFVNAKILFNNL